MLQSVASREARYHSASLGVTSTMWTRVGNHSLPGWEQEQYAAWARPCRRARCESNPCYDQRIAAPKLCSRPACCGCSFCRKGVVGRYTSPTGVVLESLTSATTPPFQFAYNPLDMDMLYARHRLMVEPVLSALCGPAIEFLGKRF